MKPGSEAVPAPRAIPVPCILLVNADPLGLGRIETLLFDQGYAVVAVSTFEMGSELLRTLAPDMLVADVRLDAFNGLHLAARSRFNQPGRPVVVTHASYDPVLDKHARDLGAAFIVKPLENPEFARHLRAVFAEQRCTERV